MYGQNPYLYQNPYTPQPQRYEVIKVNGRNGAESFQMAPNSSVLLLDETAPMVWLRQTDGAGYATTTPYTITPYTPEPPVDLKSLEQRIARIEGVLNEQSNSRSVKHTKADAAEHGTD